MRGGGSRGTASKFISRGITSSRTSSHRSRPDRYSRALEGRKRGGGGGPLAMTRSPLSLWRGSRAGVDVSPRLLTRREREFVARD